MYYSAGLGSLTAFAAAARLPHSDVFWLIARVLLDSAGGLFGLYLAVMAGLLLIGRTMRLRVRLRARRSTPST